MLQNCTMFIKLGGWGMITFPTETVPVATIYIVTIIVATVPIVAVTIQKLL